MAVTSLARHAIACYMHKLISVVRQDYRIRSLKVTDAVAVPGALTAVLHICSS